MGTLNLHLQSPDETRALAGRLAALLRPGDFIGLVGELGAGKTFFARALCEALGVPEGSIASPTFSIFHPYEESRLPLIHADLYRIEDYDELYATGFVELVSGPSVLLVEWIDKVPEAAPADWLRIELQHDSPQSRRALVEGFGRRGEALAHALR